LGLSPYQSVPENTRLDANLTYNEPMGRWSIEGWVKNLTNTATPLGAGGGFGASQIFSTLVRPPRTFGATLSVNF
jgi:outer membrane receptor protein involved in Fe transport